MKMSQFPLKFKSKLIAVNNFPFKFLLRSVAGLWRRIKKIKKNKKIKKIKKNKKDKKDRKECLPSLNLPLHTFISGIKKIFVFS